MRFLIVICLVLSVASVWSAPVSEAEFDQQYRLKMRSAFCVENTLTQCLAIPIEVCRAQFDSIYNKCQGQLFAQKKLELADLGPQKFSQLGACLGIHLSAYSTSKGKTACKTRPQDL